jgi:hypothetical protein
MSATEVVGQTVGDSTAIRPFQAAFPEAELSELRKRIKATRWPERETVTDDSQGVRLGMMQDLAHYWATDYDWRKCEAKLNALPQFITEIDGLDIHFIHVRSQHEGALPLIVTHGWPGSIIEQLKIIDPRQAGVLDRQRRRRRAGPATARGDGDHRDERLRVARAHVPTDGGQLGRRPGTGDVRRGQPPAQVDPRRARPGARRSSFVRPSRLGRSRDL